MNTQTEAIKQNLIKLKEIWISKASQHVIKETIWSFKKKLSIEYQQSILMFCQTSTLSNIFSSSCSNYIPSTNLYLGACRIFRGLDCSIDLIKKIESFEYFIRTQKQLTQSQTDICLYNLACLYEKIGSDAKAQKILKQIKGINNCVSLLKAKIYLKFMMGSIQGKGRGLSRQCLDIINRFLKISYVCEEGQFVTKLGNCKLYQMFNIGLSLKKSHKYTDAIKIFEFIVSESQNELKISVFSKINMAQCYYLLGIAQKGIKLLMQLLQSEIFEIQPYKSQINGKISIWSRQTQILQVTSNFSNALMEDVKFLMMGHQTFRNRNLLNSKLVKICQKYQQLGQLIKQNQNSKFVQKNKNFQTQWLPYKLFTHSKAKSSLKSLVSTKQSNQSRKQKCVKSKNLNKVSSINIRLKQNQEDELENHSERSHVQSQNTRLANKQLIDHYWAIIKNSQDQVEIAQIYLSLGDVYAKDDDFTNAELVYKKALDKGRYEAYGRLGNLYYKKQKNALAIEYYEKYLKYVDNSDNAMQKRLLHCYSKLPQYYKKANEKLKQVLLQNPYDTESHIMYTTVLMKQNYLTKAIEQCQQFKKLKYTCFENHHLLGLLYKYSGKLPEAHQSFISSLRLNPSHVTSLFQLFEIADVESFIPELTKIYKKALNINKQNHEIIQILLHLVSRERIDFNAIKTRLNFSQLISIGDFFLEKQMVEEAEYAYKEAAQYTNNTLLKQKLGDLEYAKQNYQKAEDYFKQSQSRKPVFKIQIKLSDSLIKQNKFVEAKQILSECLTKQSESKSICLNLLGQCEYGLGNYEEALEKFKLSMSLGYNRKVNQVWERTCHKKIIQNMKTNTHIA